MCPFVVEQTQGHRFLPQTDQSFRIGEPQHGINDHVAVGELHAAVAVVAHRQGSTLQHLVHHDTSARDHHLPRLHALLDDPFIR